MRLVGRGGRVEINGATLAHVLDWSMTITPEVVVHRGASMLSASVYNKERIRSGVFTAESDPSDTTQQALVTDATQVTLTLYESAGASYSFAALIWPSWQLDYTGKVTRAWQFRSV